MLAADKLQLQSHLKQQATFLKEKEFKLHHENFMTVGTQAAVLAGLDITMFIEFQPSANLEWGEGLEWLPRFLKFVYFITIVSAFCANMIVVSHTTTLSVLGAGMALRGPDGSMMTATDGLYDERLAVFSIFGFGLACTVGSVVICVWLILHWESAFICMIITLITCRKIYQNYQRVTKRFSFDESETVDFRDIMEGPAAIRAAPWRPMSNSLSKSSFNAEEDVEWQKQEIQNLLDQRDMKRRANASSKQTSQNGEGPGYIKTI
ncbi:unnamed protein product [Cylindrotheca closterium]|uniref:Uncharacterized protein n=1 Tax=Cylindrotheca closterium TaxID=2856 RepID=A0AAD2FSM4_9STRA|nr:unnamed protein product [Cylindrotheca closterium]